jgi:hypothetical protein
VYSGSCKEKLQVEASILERSRRNFAQPIGASNLSAGDKEYPYSFRPQYSNSLHVASHCLLPPQLPLTEPPQTTNISRPCDRSKVPSWSFWASSSHHPFNSSSLSKCLEEVDNSSSASRMCPVILIGIDKTMMPVCFEPFLLHSRLVSVSLPLYALQFFNPYLCALHIY